MHDKIPYSMVFDLDIEQNLSYYIKSVNKTEQQKFLEDLLTSDSDFENASTILDLACGSGTLSYHLAKLNRLANFRLVDSNRTGIELAKKINILNKDRFSFQCQDIYSALTENRKYDYVFFWQTLFMLDSPLELLEQIPRCVNCGGRVLISSLFNIDHDVDLKTTVTDYTRPSGMAGYSYVYNTLSALTVKRCLDRLGYRHKLTRFNIGIDLGRNGRGIGTYTMALKDDDVKLQISGGMLLNWAILEIFC